MSKQDRDRFVPTWAGLILSTFFALVGCVRSQDDLTGEPSSAKPEKHPRFLAWIDSRITIPHVHAISPNGRIAIAHTQTETIAYDLPAQKEIKHWPSAVSRWSFSSDSRRLLRIQADEISVLATDSLDTLSRWKAKPKLPRQGQTNLQLGACISPDGSLIAVENRDGCFDAAVDSDILILNVDTESVTRQIDFPFDPPKESRSFKWEYSFVGANDRMLLTLLTHRAGETLRQSRLMHIDEAKLLCELPANGTVRYAKDQKLIAVGECKGRSDTRAVPTSVSGEIQIINVRTGSRQRSIEFTGTLRDFDIDPNGARVLASVQRGDAKPPAKVAGFAPDRNARLTELLEWDVKSGKLTRKIKPPRLPVAQIRYGRDSFSYLVAMERPDGVDDGLEHVCELKLILTGKQLTHDDWLQRGTISKLHQDLFLYPDLKRFIVRGGTVQIRALEDGKTLWQADAKGHPVHDAAFSPDGEYCWASGFLSRLCDGHQRSWHSVTRLKFIDSGDAVFFQGNNAVGIASLRTSDIQWRQGFHWSRRLISADISPDTNTIAVVVAQNNFWTSELPEHKVVLIDRRNEDEPRSLDIDAKCACFDPTGETILIATNEAIEQVNVESGATLRRTGPLPGDPLAIQISPEGKRLFVAGQSVATPNGFRNVMGTGWLVLVDLERDSVQQVHSSDTPITCVTLSDDGDTLAAANLASDTTESEIWVWDAPTAQSNGPLRRRFSIDGHRLGINDLVFSPDARMLLAAADDGAALWDLRSNVAAKNDRRNTDNVVFPRQLTLVENANTYRGDVRRAPPYQGPLLFPESPEAKESLRPKANWPLVLINESSNANRGPAEKFKESKLWLRNARQRIPVQFKVDWQSAESAFVRRYEMGPRSNDWRLQIAFDQKERRPVLLDENHEILQTYPKIFDHYQSTLSPSGRRVAIYSEETRRRGVGNNQLQIDLLDATTAEKLWTSSPVTGVHVSGIEMDHQDQFVTVNDNAYATIVFDGETGKLLARYQPKHGSHLLTRLSPIGQFVATGQRSLAGVILRDPRTLKEVKTLATQFGINWLRWTPNGNRVLAGQSYGDGMELVQCWDVESGESRWTRRLAASRNVTFDQAGDWMLTRSQVGEDGNVLCRVSNGSITAVFSISGSSPMELPVLSKSGGVVYLRAPNERVVWPMQERP